MPLGDFIAELGLRYLLELIFYGLFYWVGFLVIKIVSFGTIQMAPLSSFEERNRRKKKNKKGWSIWLHRPMQGKMLKAERAHRWSYRAKMFIALLVFVAAIIVVVFL